MKKPYLILGAFMTLFTVETLKADIISLWNFDSLTLSTAYTNATPDGYVTNITADVGSGTAFGYHTTAAAVYSTPAGNGSSKSLSANNWTVGDYYEFVVSSVGYVDLSVAFDMYRSATGPTNFTLQYSLDGTSFSSFSTFSITNSPSISASTYNSAFNYSFDLSAIDSLEDTSSVYFRVTDATAPSGTGGTARIDNFTVTGTVVPVPEPSSIALAALGGVACLVAVRRRR